MHKFMENLELAFELHMHSCLSPCGSDDNTPANLAAMCSLAGLQLAALTDHNTCRNCRAFAQAARPFGLLTIPGMELTTAEEVHVVCLFPHIVQAELFSAFIRQHLPQIPHNPHIFGEQILMDHQDHVLGHESAFLAGATDIGIYQTASLVESFGGFAFPAHIDRPSFSLLSNLGLWDPAMGFHLAELSPNCPPELPQRPDLQGLRFLHNCDAHYLDQIPDPHQWMSLPEKSPEAVFDWLKN